MPSKEEALKQIVKIARCNGLTATEISKKLSSTPPYLGSRRSSLSRYFSYMGAIFVLAGLIVFIEMQWSAMNSMVKCLVALGSGTTCFVIALFVYNNSRCKHVVTPLFLLASAIQPIGVMVAMGEFLNGDNFRQSFLLTSVIMLILQTVVFLRTKRAALLFTVVTFAVLFAGTAMNLLGLEPDLTACLLGLSVLLVTYLINQSTYATITPFWYFTGSISLLGGLFDFLKNSSLEVLFLGPACGIVFLSTRVNSRLLLLIGTVAILLFTGYYTAEHFSDVVGWPITLIALGLLLIGFSAVAIRISRTHISK